MSSASSSSEATGRTASAEPTSTASAATASDSIPFVRNAAIDSAPERFDSPPPPASVRRL